MELRHRSSFAIAPVPPFDFKLTVKKPAGWSLFNAGEAYKGETLWTATRLIGRLVGLKLCSVGTLEKPRILVTVFTKLPMSRQEKRRIMESLETLTGANQDLKDFYRMAERDDILVHTVKDLYGMHDTQTAYLFNSVVLSICLQMAKLDRSEKMMASINRTYGTKVEFDGTAILVEPEAETIASARARWRSSSTGCSIL